MEDGKCDLKPLVGLIYDYFLEWDRSDDEHELFLELLGKVSQALRFFLLSKSDRPTVWYRLGEDCCQHPNKNKDSSSNTCQQVLTSSRIQGKYKIPS
jgi:hypothetical protein